MTRSQAGCWMRFGSVAILLLSVLVATCAGQSCTQTANFRVCGPMPLNQQVAQAAEIARKVWAERWFGRTLPDWSAPAEIKIVADNTDGGGTTHFVFDRGEAYGWSGNWQGRPDRLVATVVPHEVTHMLLASYFRRPLPRWIDEGCAMLAEPRIGRHNWRHSYHWLPFPRFLGMTEYPKNWFGGLDQAGVRSLYSEALTLSEFVVWHRGYPALPALAERYVETGSWDKAFTALLGCDVATLEPRVYSWVQARQPPPPDGKQGSHQWTANGWRAIRYDSPRTAAVGSAYKTEQARRLVPVLPVKPATGRPVVGGLSSPGRSGESLKEIRVVRGPLWDRLTGQNQPTVTVPAQSTATTTAPLWQSPAPTVQTAVPDQVYAELDAVRNELAALAGRAATQGAPTDVTDQLLSMAEAAKTSRLAMESRLAKRIDQSEADIRATTAEAAKTSRLAIVGDIFAAAKSVGITALFAGGFGLPALIAGALAILRRLVKRDLDAYRKTGGADPTYLQQIAARTPWRWDDPLAKWLSDVAVTQQKNLEEWFDRFASFLKSEDEEIKQHVTNEVKRVQPAGGTAK